MIYIGSLVDIAGTLFGTDAPNFNHDCGIKKMSGTRNGF
jgi:hypothetical protein